MFIVNIFKSCLQISIFVGATAGWSSPSYFLGPSWQPYSFSLLSLLTAAEEQKLVTFMLPGIQSNFQSFFFLQI